MVGLIDPDLAAELLETRDQTLFADRLLQIAGSVSGIEELFAYRIDDRAAPRVLASTSELGEVAERADAYARRFHRSDPAADAWRAAPPDSGFACRVPASAIELAAYRKLCFDRPRFAEKICFGWRKADHATIVTFYQRDIGAEPDMAQLGALAQLAITGLTRLTQTAPPLLEQVEQRLSHAYPVLTRRERQVCARTLTGATARQIGAELDLGPATVLTYRQRAYQKLGLHKASDLLAAIMS